MSFDRKKKILIVGLGLIGGSYARALTRRGYYVTAITRDQESIDYALKNKIISKGSSFPDVNLISEADLIVFAVYPHVLTDWLEKYQQHFKSGVIITDVTGVKGSIVYKIQEMLRTDAEFIGAHPMAGKEVYGVENTEEAIELCEELGWTLGFGDVSRLSPEKHDEMIAFLSQLTHCIAVSLMCAKDDPDLVRYTGDSFRDLTRIAKINDDMWSELFLENKQPLLDEMDRFKAAFDEMYNCVKNGDRDKMRDMMRCSTERRGFFDKNR